MAILNLTKTTTVEALRKEFNDAFGAQVKLYNGNKKADPGDTLGTLGLVEDGTFECRSSLTVASFIDRMAERGLKVKVYTCDEWVAVLDGLTLESAGKVKKNAVKADMESMIAYQRKDNDLQGYVIEAREDGGYIVRKDGVECENAKAAMREMAAILGLEVDPAWTTRQLGAKLLKIIGGEPIERPADNSAAQQAAAAKADAEKAAAAAQAEKEKAEAAKAEQERIKAEAAKAQAEAEKAKAAAAAAQAEKEKAEADKKATPSHGAANNQGALPGLFSVGENKKVRFSQGNLQFHCKNYEFRFAEHQWDTVSLDDNKKVGADFDGWIDVFGYGTSGYMGCQPYESSTNASQYPKGSIAGTNYDWGVYNPISNGGNKEGLWRTMTGKEWRYLLRERPNATKLNIKGTVNGKEGMILLPDDFYEKRVRIPIDSTPDNYSTNSYSGDTWKALEEAGAVFRPEQCIKKDSWEVWKEVASWTASIYIDWRPYRASEDDGTIYSNNNCNFFKCSVRLVQDVK